MTKNARGAGRKEEGRRKSVVGHSRPLSVSMFEKVICSYVLN